MSEHVPQSGGQTASISDSEAISLLTHEISNTLMLLQSRLDMLRSQVGSSRAFHDIESACLESAKVLRGASGLIGKHENPKSLIGLGNHLEYYLETFAQSAHHHLRLRTHRECEVYTSPETLNLVVSQVLHHFHAAPADPEPSIYIEVYKGSFEENSFGVIQMSGPGQLSTNQGIWKMLESLMHLQGGELVTDSSQEQVQINLMFPIFQKRHSVYTMRSQTEVNTALVVEDNQGVAESISMTVQALGIAKVEVFSKATDAIAWLDSHTPGLVITDYSMFGMSGIEFLKQCQTALASSTVVLISGMPPEEFTEELSELSIPVEVLMKPLKGDDLLRIVMQSLSNHSPKNNGEIESRTRTVHASQAPTDISDPISG